MESCIYIPQVTDKSGKSVDSILYKDIKKIVKDYNTAWELYSKTLTQEFKDVVGTSLDLDENGEPTIESILSQTDLLFGYKDSTLAGIIKKEETKLGRYDSKR